MRRRSSRRPSAMLTAGGTVAAAGGQIGTGAAAACKIPQGSEPVGLDPADFTTQIDNPYWPMEPGSRWVYRETDPEGTKQRVVVTVTSKTKRIANGVAARVVHDVVTEDGKPVEVTDDWYAQDRAGTSGTWARTRRSTRTARSSRRRARSRRASTERRPGSSCPPSRGRACATGRSTTRARRRTEAEVVSVDEQVEVPFGHFGQGSVLMTKDLNPLEPKVLEYKFYARGVGPVLAIARVRRQRPRGAGQLLERQIGEQRREGDAGG